MNQVFFVNDFVREEWEENNWFWKIYLVLKAPLDVLFKITIPL